MEDSKESNLEENDKIRQQELEESLLKYEKILERKRKNNELLWEEVVDFLKRKQSYKEFDADPILETRLKESFKEGKENTESISKTREQVLVKYYIENLDIEAGNYSNNYDKAALFRRELDNLCKQRILSRQVEDVFLFGMYDAVLEVKITLVSIRYYRISGTGLAN